MEKTGKNQLDELNKKPQPLTPSLTRRRGTNSPKYLKVVMRKMIF